MSVYIPFGIQAEIIKRLPIKSLIRFRSVSKPWKSLIESSEFIATYNVPHPQHILVCCVDREEDTKLRYVSIVDDDTFPQHKSYPSVPMPVKQIDEPGIIGSSQGLFCLYNLNQNSVNSGTVVLWNPSIRKSVVVDVPNVFYEPYSTVVGFGVCPRTNDPKLVKISYPVHLDEISTISMNIPWQVEVFTLSSRAWRILSIDQPWKSVILSWNQVVMDRFIYWFAARKISTDTGLLWCYAIISFDMTSETFTELSIPNGLALFHHFDLFIYKLRDSLVLLEPIIEDVKFYDVWMIQMEHGVPNSFTKLFTIKVPDMSVTTVLEFRKSGEPLAVLSEDIEDGLEGTLFVYEPYSKHIIDVGISANACSCLASSYMETLLLLDH